MTALVRATVKLYLSASLKAFKAFKTHPFKPLFGFIFILVTGLVESNAGLFPGFAGGMLLGLAMTFILAGFLALVNLIFDAKKFTLQEAVNLTTGIFGPLINSLFILFIAKFLLQPVLMKTDAQLILGILYIALFVLFNSLPEIVSRKGIGGVDSFRESLDFMKENGPEWLVGVFIVFIPLMIISGPVFVMSLISSDDPLNVFFNLIRYSVLAFSLLTARFSFPGLPLVQLLLMGIGMYYVFFIFLFRAALFEELNRTTRRKRVYAASNE